MAPLAKIHPTNRLTTWGWGFTGCALCHTVHTVYMCVLFWAHTGIFLQQFIDSLNTVSCPLFNISEYQ